MIEPSPASPSAVELGYDPWSPAFVADPYPALARLRAGPAALFDERTGQWLVSRHADVNALLRDRRLGRTYHHVATNAEWGRPDPPADEAAFWRLLDIQMIDQEPPDHTRLRRLVSAAFTPRTVERLRPRIDEIATRLVDGGRGPGRVRPDRRPARAAAGRRDRRAARDPRARSRPAPAVVGRHDPGLRARTRAPPTGPGR